MAKTVRTSGDYTIKTGAGSGGSNAIFLDSQRTVVEGNLEVKGTQTSVDSTSLKVEDNFIIVARNNSGPADIDAGIMVERGAANNAAFYWNEGDDVFKAVVTATSAGSNNAIADTALAKIRVAEPAHASDAARRNYVDTQVSGGGFSLKIAGDDSTAITVASGQLLQFVGGTNISTVGSEPDTITLGLDRDLNGIDSISTDRSNQDLLLTANGTASVVIEDVLTFSNAASTPAATAITKIYNKTAAGGGTGLYFINSAISSGAEGELISKKKATALAIALG